MPTQVHCAVLFSRAANLGMGELMNRLCQIEALIKGDTSVPITPSVLGAVADIRTSANLPAQEVGAEPN